MTVHQVRVQELDLAPPLTVLCAGYELAEWRAQQLVDDLFGRHLASFALSFTELNSIDGTTAATSLKKAAKSVYASDKYKRRGEFGELILHAAAKDFFQAHPAVSKIFYKDSDNDTVKGFDCVHLVENDGDIELWLGEVKFYQSLAKAIADSTDELRDHLKSEFLRREFVAITNKLDPDWPHTQAVIELLDDARSLDEIVSKLVVPVLLTFDSSAVSNHERTGDEYLAELRSEAEAGWKRFTEALSLPFPVALHLILVPLQDKARLVNLFHQKLRVWQHI